VARQRSPSRDMALTCNNSRLTSPRIAHLLPALAPSLAPRNPSDSARTGSGPLVGRVLFTIVNSLPWG